MDCEYCKQTFKTKYILKSHTLNSKSCLKLRGLVLESKFSCIACEMKFSSNINLNVHLDTCKKYIIHKVRQDYGTTVLLQQQKINELEETINESKNNQVLLTKLEIKYDNLYEQNEELKKNLIDFTTISSQHTELKFSYRELSKRHEELEKQHEKTINKLEMKISQCDDFIKMLAREGSNKVTTTHNTVNNTVRNQLSATFTLDNLEPKKLEETIREHYTERDFFGGQKRLANFFLERVIKTPDDKMLICCTDTSRKKFKILDDEGI